MQSVTGSAALVTAMLLLLGTASIHYSDSGHPSCGGSPIISVQPTTGLNRMPVPESPANSKCSIINDLLPTRHSCRHQFDVGALVERAITILRSR
jgi:hypothetical protein